MQQLALIIFALMILANAAWYHFAKPEAVAQNISTNTIYLSGGKLATGIYQLDPKTTLGDLYQQAGLRLPPAPFDQNRTVPFNATVTLKDGQPPEISGTDPTLAPLVFAPIPINKASAKQLATINGIGPKLAHRIIKYRSIHGGFTKPEQLLKVKGIGPHIIKKITALISFS